MSSRYSKLRQQVRENGLATTAVRTGERLANDYAPPWLLRFRRILVMGMAGPAPERVPSLSGITSRCLAIEESHELDSVFPGTSRHHEFFRDGSICAVAIAERKICAMAWARIGPGDCVVDDSVRHGFRWALEEGEAWLHNGEALGEARGSGVYLTAFRRLMEEMVIRGVKRCYALISDGNTESLRKLTGAWVCGRLRACAMLGWEEWATIAGKPRLASAASGRSNGVSGYSPGASTNNSEFGPALTRLSWYDFG